MKKRSPREKQGFWWTARLIIIAAKLMFLRRIRAEAPMMDFDEIVILREILSLTNPIRCLEWGLGFSTTYFSKLLGPEARWNSVEHDREWYIKISRKLRQQKRVALSLVEPEHFPWTDSHNDGALSDLKSYVNYPKDLLLGSFDFILIDGRARRECLALAQDLVSENGVVVLHDANRRNYFEGKTRTFPYEYDFLDHRDEGGLFIGAMQSLDPEMSWCRKMWKFTCILRKRKNMILKKIKMR